MSSLGETTLKKKKKKVTARIIVTDSRLIKNQFHNYAKPDWAG